MREDLPVEPDRAIDELQALEFAADPAFREAVQKSIDRRITAGEMVRLSTLAVVHVVLEFLTLGRPERPEPGAAPVPEE